MAENPGISWTHYTFNIWSGCTKISAGCTHCYAAAKPSFMVRGAKWGNDEARVAAPDAYLHKLFKWHRDAVEAGEFRRVFTGSVMDIGEDRPELVPLRDAALALVALTPPTKRASDGKLGGLNHLWLTKRPEVLADYFADPALYGRVLVAADRFRRVNASLGLRPISDPGKGLATWYPHLWVGTSVEDQKAADERIPHLLRIPARVRFLSMEPLLGAVDLSRWIASIERCDYCGDERRGPIESDYCPECDRFGGLIGVSGEAQAERLRSGERYNLENPLGVLDCDGGWPEHIDWVIVGGESGRHARPMHPDWARSLRDQCEGAVVPFFFKQWGEWAPRRRDDGTPFSTIARHNRDRLVATDGTLHCSWVPAGEQAHPMSRVGKHAAGRILDGRIWDEFPAEAP